MAFRKKDPDTGGSDTFHKRWVRLSIPELAEKIGHSTTALLRKLTNAGVWLREAGKLVRRYSTGRVETNFQLWRRRKNDPEARSRGGSQEEMSLPREVFLLREVSLPRGPLFPESVST
jgi:hypothetical protein